MNYLVYVMLVEDTLLPPPLSWQVKAAMAVKSRVIWTRCWGEGKGRRSHLSVTTWTHLNNISCVEWSAGTKSLYFHVHLNRMDECGVGGGSPLFASPTHEQTEIGPPPCRAPVVFNNPLMSIHSGGGAFYNWYNEDAMGADKDVLLQGADYRHLLVYSTTCGTRFYHLNPEHASCDANCEISHSQNVSVFGTKSEGHSPTLWIRDSNHVLHTGHSGNARPPNEGSQYPPGFYQCPPSLFRVERSSNVRLANLWTYFCRPQDKKWNSVYWPQGGAINLTRPLERPVLFAQIEP
eukprot:m.162062 g.162062  ORF g.162062 m.162062 type:complete len:292 (+) comp24871_c0_seq1:2611-3486(+)